MRWRNTETPTFAGSNNTAAQGPDVVETFDLLDRDGNVVAAVTKAVDGTVTLALTGNLSVTGDASVSGNVTEIITEAELSLSDNTTANSSTTKHGFLKKLSNVATEFMNGAGNWAAVTKSDVGLGNVDNTSDATKNAAAVTLTNKTLTSPVINTPTGIVKGDVGLGNVDNTSDANKPISTATQTALDARLRVAKATYSFAVSGGAQGTIAPVASDTIPDNAIIIGGQINSTTAVTSDGAATVAIGTSAGSSTTSIKAATGKASYSVDALLNVVPTFAAALKLTAAGTITFTIADADLTAGVIEVFVFYVVASA